MTTTKIILAILSSSVLSAVLTSFINWRIHNSNYKKDYYKKLLDKRLDAYESLNTLIINLSSVVYTEKGFIQALFCGTIGFKVFNSELHKAIDKSFWLDDLTSHKLTELSAFIFNNVSGCIDDNLEEDILTQKYLELGIKYYNEIEDYKNFLKETMNKELKELYKINNFFNDNRGGNKTYPVYEKEINKK